MTRRLFAASLAVFAASTLLAASPAAAAPPAANPVQIDSGTGMTSGFTASLPRRPQAGNVVIIVTGLDSAPAVGVLDADDSAHVINLSETFNAFAVSGAPYAIMWGAAADPNVKQWSFHGTPNQKATWLAFELTGMQVRESGVPIFDGPALGSSVDVTGTQTQISSGHRSATAVPHELVFAIFVARVASGTPPTVSAFTNTFAQPGTWARFGTTVATSGAGVNHRLDVAWKEVTTTSTYDCTATYSAAPAGMASSLTGLYAV